MTRRFFCAGLAALVAGCSGAGVTTTDLRGKLAAEIARVIATIEQVEPYVAPPATFARLNTALGAVKPRIAASHAEGFSIDELNALRRFYASPDGQTVVALAFAEEGGGDKPSLDADQYTRVDAAFADPVIARSVSLLRTALRDAFAGEPVFAAR